MDWKGVSGNRSDGTVKLAVIYGNKMNPVKPLLNVHQEIAEATRMCKIWGYTGAVAFGEKQTECTGRSGFTDGCVEYTLTKVYQCTK